MQVGHFVAWKEGNPGARYRLGAKEWIYLALGAGVGTRGGDESVV